MAILVARQSVGARGGVLLHLRENPGVGGGGAADHDGVATGFLDDARGVHGRLNIAVANHGNLHGLLYGGDDFPVGAAGVALLAGARVHGDSFDAYAFGEFRDLDGHDGVFVPASAKLDRERNADGGAHGAEDLLQQREVAEQAGATAFHDLLGGAAEVDVHGVVAEVFDHFGGVGHDLGIGAEELRSDGVFVFLKI